MEHWLDRKGGRGTCTRGRTSQRDGACCALHVLDVVEVDKTAVVETPREALLGLVQRSFMSAGNEGGVKACETGSSWFCRRATSGEIQW